MSYSIDQVPGFLLHDGISWCRKYNRAHVRFFQIVDGNREYIIATPAMILEEIVRRKDETKTLRCANCGADTDDRCCFVAHEPLCEPCYWTVLKNMRGSTPTEPVASPKRGNVLMMPDFRTEQPSKEPHEETPEEIAARLGVSLDVLQASGYFD